MNSFGRLFRISIFGESHGTGTGILIDGCSSGLEINETDFELVLSKRKPGKKGTTTRIEKDIPKILSGVLNSKSTGAPILIMFENNNTDSSVYNSFSTVPRPGHADFVSMQKFGGFSDLRGGGHFSGRLTLAIVAAGVIAKKLLNLSNKISIFATLTQIGGSINIDEKIQECIKEGDSVGGIIECKIVGLPIGLGEPFFDSLESLLSHAIFSIPAIKGIEFGSGFKGATMKGSENNDLITDASGKTLTNNSGGINGGISNGNDLVFRLAVKPTSSISKSQTSIDLTTNSKVELNVKGRHDVCIALRMPIIVEAMVAIVLADTMLIEQKIRRVINSK